MKQIILLNVQTKKEFDVLLRRWEEEWELNQRRINRILRHGF